MIRKIRIGRHPKARQIAYLLAVAAALVLPASSVSAQKCVNIFHDEAPASPVKGSINAIYLANLMGHWPEYEVRVAPISDYRSEAARACRTTFFLATGAESGAPQDFVNDFLGNTPQTIAWIGFGLNTLNQDRLAARFGYRAAGQLEADPDAEQPSFFEYVLYKGSLFVKDSSVSENEWEADSEALDLVPAPAPNVTSANVLAELVHNQSGERKPYVLQQGNRYIVGDNPFSYMHEGGRYFVFADLLFDMLGEKPRRTEKLAFVRIEDIHALYDVDLLKATFATLRSEGAPISIAHIPLFMDPYNGQGYGAIKKPLASHTKPEFADLITKVLADPRNALIWHGVTHQLDLQRNPASGSSGDDYEFWNAVDEKPLKDETHAKVAERLRRALPVFDAFGVKPRYWVTPHYKASATANQVFGAVFPWVVGRVNYYPTSFGASFTLPPAGTLPTAERGVDGDVLTSAANQPWPGYDARSEDGIGQIFPFEIYRDVYGQSVIPETLGYLDVLGEGPPVRDVAAMLADAQRNLVVRDYWASFFFHPFIFESPESGGGGRYFGDTARLRKLLIGLKGMGYRFVGLPEFEKSLKPVEQTQVEPRAPD